MNLLDQVRYGTPHHRRDKLSRLGSRVSGLQLAVERVGDTLALPLRSSLV